MRREDGVGVDFRCNLHEGLVARLTCGRFRAAGGVRGNVHPLDPKVNPPARAFCLCVFDPLVRFFAQAVMHVHGRHRLDDVAVGAFFQAHEHLDESRRVPAARIGRHDPHRVDGRQAKVLAPRCGFALGDLLDRLRHELREFGGGGHGRAGFSVGHCSPNFTCYAPLRFRARPPRSCRSPWPRASLRRSCGAEPWREPF